MPAQQPFDMNAALTQIRTLVQQIQANNRAKPADSSHAAGVAQIEKRAELAVELADLFGQLDAAATPARKAPADWTLTFDMDDAEIAATMRRFPDVALFGAWWLRQMSKQGVSPFQLVGMARELRSNMAAADSAAPSA